MRQISDCGAAKGYGWTGLADGMAIPVPPEAVSSRGQMLAQLWIPGHPRTKGSLAVEHHGGKARLTDTASARAWLKHMAAHGRRLWEDREPIEADVIVSAWFRYWRPGAGLAANAARPTNGQFGDLDKLLRSILDAIQLGRIIANDRQVSDIISSKSWALPPERAGVIIHIEEAV